MPALRNIPVGMGMAPRTRRRSSVFAPAKAGVYGVQNPSHNNHASHLPPRPISFAPNVTPVTFNESSDSSSPSTPEPGSPSALPKLFPPSETPAPPPARKRCPPGKRRSQGYIPRPPNAFMLFRADFVRQKHVPGSIETNHGSLSKIIGNCWRSLPLDEKKVWETRAKHEKAAHKIAYPNYRFRPVHNKNKKKDGGEVAPSTSSNSANSKAGTKGGDKKDKHEQTFEEEIRCEEVTQLLLEGKKGEELAQALRDLEKRRLVHSHSQSTHGLYLSNTQDYRRSETPSTASSIPFGGIMSAPQPTYPSPMLFGGPNATPLYMHRRSSSVPLPNNHFPSYPNANAFDWSSGVGGDYMMDAPPPPYEFESAPSQDQDLGGSNISIPSVPFLPPPSSGGLAASAHANGPRFSISQQQRMMLGHRRSSSAGAAFGGLHAQQRGWDAPMPMSFGGGFDGAGFAWPGQQAQGNGGEMVLQRDDSALPEADLSLFNPSFLSGHSDLHSQSVGPMDALVENVDAGSVHGGNGVEGGVAGIGAGTGGVGGSAGATPNGCFSVSDLYQGLPPQALGPLDIGPDAMAYQQEQAHHHHHQQSSQDLHHLQQQDLHHHQQQQQQWDGQQQQNDGGLQLEFAHANVEAEAEAAQYEQMYLAEQHAQYLMGGYDVATAGGEAQYEGGMGYEYGAGQYVEC
ncbi:hypothetical protein DFP72DRAFT_872057 [Ephemerocybe angulata]|uniref:HMG box domain-containing protein n=1 Tax=Ephemerocybe angulata TaxID=980116 RepID=A0A8H6IF69_9AGAR|nr:hypothetical protein DFP72DRAFT_872057 [Tulosesus angulatus]